MPSISKSTFIREFSCKVMDGNVALFVGAGLSQPAGYVDWKGLLNEIAEDLGLKIDLENDLIAIAQYHQNERGNRTKLNEKLIQEFTKDAKPTLNHKLIAQLPIHTIWTTNYDTLLEDAFKVQKKLVDLKTTNENVALTRSGIDATIFKMHGDVSQPNKAVLTKEDYETYNLNRELFTIRLKSDLVSLTFLFLGFSFSDPNIDYILSRIRNLLGQNNLPNHYCIIKRPQPVENPSPEETAEYEYEVRKLGLRVEDLKRYGIQTVLIGHYEEITEILQELNHIASLKNIFVSGSAVEGTKDFDLLRLFRLARDIGNEIIKQGYNLVSGYGIGVGSELLVGALEGAYISPTSMRERLILRPFPISVGEAQRSEVYRKWREDIVILAGFSIFLAGNKFAPENDGKVIIGEGVIEEFKLSTTLPAHCFPIPVGATGHAAREIWNIVNKDLTKFFDSVDVSNEMAILNNPENSNEDLIKAIFNIINMVQN